MSRSKAPHPYRVVVKALSRTGHAILNPALYTQWWDLTLECGHTEERSLRFPKQTGPHPRRGYAALHRPRCHNEALPAPKKVRCRQCGFAS